MNFPLDRFDLELLSRALNQYSIGDADDNIRHLGELSRRVHGWLTQIALDE